MFNERKHHIRPLFILCKLVSQAPNVTDYPLAKTHRICVDIQNSLWQKWGGHVHWTSDASVMHV